MSLNYDEFWLIVKTEEGGTQSEAVPYLSAHAQESNLGVNSGSNCLAVPLWANFFFFSICF